MAKVQKSLRIDSEVYQAIQEVKQDHESESQILNRVLRVGVESLTQDLNRNRISESLADMYKTRIDDLRHINKLLEDQIERKDDEIKTLCELASNAQMVAGMTSANTNKALEQTNAPTTQTNTTFEANNKPSLKERMKNFFS